MSNPPLFGNLVGTSSTSPFGGANTASPFAGSSSFSFTPAATFGAGAASKDDDDEDGEEGEGDGEGADADETHAGEFAAIVSLPKIEVKSMEEDEDVMFRMRAKLYVFVKEDVYGGEERKNWWRERGLGDIKILKHKHTGVSRLLMRQEKTHKICLNHLIDPKTVLTAQAGSEVSVNFTALDHADPKGEAKVEKYAVKFGTAETVATFKTAFEAAKALNKATEGKAPTGDVAAKLAALSVTPSSGSPKKAEAKASPATPAQAPAAAAAAAPALASQPGAAAGGDAQARAAAEFAIKQMAKGSLVKLASAKGTPVEATKFKLALHVKNAAGEVHAHVATVLVAGEQMMLLDSKQTGLVE